MSSTTVTYRGLGSVVTLDLGASTVTVTHFPPSEHVGAWTVPLDEITDVHYRERTEDQEGWGQIRTLTGQHSKEPALDPYAFRNGGEQLKTFCLLIYVVTRKARDRTESRAVRGVLGDELASMRDLIGRLRDR